METKIAKEAGTSRTPIREALRSLEAEELVKSIPRFGYLVEGISVEDLEQICELREVIVRAHLRGTRRTSSFLKGASRTICKKLKSTHRIRDGGPWPDDKSQKANLAYTPYYRAIAKCVCVRAQSHSTFVVASQR